MYSMHNLLNRKKTSISSQMLRQSVAQQIRYQYKFVVYLIPIPLDYHLIQNCDEQVARQPFFSFSVKKHPILEIGTIFF